MERKEISELDEMYQYHTPTAEEVVVMKEISVLAHVLSKKITDAVQARPHSVAFDLKCESLLGIKSAVMQANAALIIGRAVRDKEKDAEPKAEDILRADLHRAINAVHAMAKRDHEVKIEKYDLGVRKEPVAAAIDAGYGKGSDPYAGQAEPTFTAKEVIERIKKANPGLVIKVRRRKAR